MRGIMPSSKRTLLDYLVILFMLLLAACIFVSAFMADSEKKSVCIVLGNETQYYSLSENRTVELETAIGKTVVRIEKGQAFIESSECDNQICVKSKHAEKTGDTIICAPADVAVMIVKSGGGAYENADAAAG